MKPFRYLGSVLGLVLLSASTAAAFPIAAVGTEGVLVVGGGNTVIATYLGNSADFSNDLYLLLDATGAPGDDGVLSNDLFIFNNHSSTVGATTTLGNFVLGAELIFRIHVNNTGIDYFTGAPSRNPDNQAHARVQDNFLPGATLVSFEDLFNTPEGAFGYNDLSFSFLNTAAAAVAAPVAKADTITETGPVLAQTIPEPGSLLLLGMGLSTFAARRRRQ